MIYSGLLILVVVLILYGLFFVISRWPRKKLSAHHLKEMQRKWHAIEESVAAHPRLAVIDADTLFDHALKLNGYTGSLGDKLKRNPKLFSDLSALWAAHKLRNTLVHEVDAKVSHAQAMKALATFRRSFNDVGIKI